MDQNSGSKSFCLNLETHDCPETDETEAIALQGTNLEHFAVYIGDSGQVVSRLTAFIGILKPALSSVTHLEFHLDINMHSNWTGSKHDLNRVLELLVGCSPAMTSFTVSGELCCTLSKQFLDHLSKHCPLLSHLGINGSCEDLKYFEDELLQQLPSLFPNFCSIRMAQSSWVLPSMSQMESILSVDVPFEYFFWERTWCYLPPNLQHLKCYHIGAAPSLHSNSTPLLQSLLTISTQRTTFCLSVLADLFRTATALQKFSVGGNDASKMQVICDHSEFTGTNISLLLGKIKTGVIKHAVFSTKDGGQLTELQLQQWIVTQPAH